MTKIEEIQENPVYIELTKLFAEIMPSLKDIKDVLDEGIYLTMKENDYIYTLHLKRRKLTLKEE